MCKMWKEQIAVKDKWLRILYMLLFAIVNYVVQCFIWVVALFQAIVVLFVGIPNQRLLGASQHLCRYSFEIMRFLTYNTEVKPYPFSDWPTNDSEPPSQKEENELHLIP